MTERVSWRGSRFDPRTLAQIQEAERLAGARITPTQGSWSGAAASAGTHSGCGALDASVRGITRQQADAIVLALRKVGMAAWYRTAPPFDMPHIHAISVQPGNRRGCLAQAAHDQVHQYLNGTDGLARRGKDPGPRGPWVGITWEQYQQQQRQEDDMTPEQATLLGNIGYAVDQIRTNDLPALRKEVADLRRTVHALQQRDG